MIWDFLRARADEWSGREVVCLDRRRWSYAQVLESASRLAGAWQEVAGAAVGLRVSTLPELLIALLALDALRTRVFIVHAGMDEGALSGLSEMHGLARIITLEPGFAAGMDVGPGTEASRPALFADGGDDEGWEGQIVLFTSGTSGPPKPVLHTWRSLTAGVKFQARYEGKRWLLTFNPTGFAGLQVLLQALLTGGCICTPAERTAGSLATCLVEEQAQFASGTPTLWRMILACLSREDLGGVAITQITLGGEVVDQPILDQLKAAFPAARLIHIYASTEMGACFVVDDETAGFPASYLDDDRLPCQLRISDDGELLLRSRRAMLGYVRGQDWDPAAWFHSGDMVERSGRRIIFAGRRSETINVGGNKVFPSEVEAVILAVSGVGRVRVRAMKNGMVGEVVVADVVVLPDVDRKDLKERVFAACRERLQKYKVPALIKFVEEIGLTDSGKLSRVQ